MRQDEASGGTTAWEAWDARWRTPEGRARWLEPAAEIRALALELGTRGARQVLDLGCGVGRHAIFLAGEGFTVSALDAAEAGLGYARDWAARRALNIDFRSGLMTALPYADRAFDAVVAWNVVYHGVPPEVDRALAEIRRVLRPGGLLFTTFLSTRHARFGHGIEIAPNTFVIEGHEERAHPHYYCDAPAVLRHLSGFALWSLADRVHEWPATYHWHALAERLPDPPLSRPA